MPTRIIMLGVFSVAALAMAVGVSASSFLPAPIVQVSGPSPFAAGCDPGQDGVAYVNSEVEPWLAVNPANVLNMVGVWQQDRSCAIS